MTIDQPVLGGRRPVALLTRVLVPDNIPALLSGNQQIQVPVEIDIDGSDVIGGLSRRDDMRFEIAFPVVLEPGGNLTAVSARGGIDVSVVIHVDDLKTVRKLKIRIDVVNLPVRRFKPDHAHAVAARRDEVNLAIAIDVGLLNARGSWMLSGKFMASERSGGVFRSFPPVEPFAHA